MFNLKNFLSRDSQESRVLATKEIINNCWLKNDIELYTSLLNNLIIKDDEYTENLLNISWDALCKFQWLQMNIGELCDQFSNNSLGKIILENINFNNFDHLIFNIIKINNSKLLIQYDRFRQALNKKFNIELENNLPELPKTLEIVWFFILLYHLRIVSKDQLVAKKFIEAIRDCYSLNFFQNYIKDLMIINLFGENIEIQALAWTFLKQNSQLVSKKLVKILKIQLNSDHKNYIKLAMQYFEADDFSEYFEVYINQLLQQIHYNSQCVEICI